jgi:hypothetical protein
MFNDMFRFDPPHEILVRPDRGGIENVIPQSALTRSFGTEVLPGSLLRSRTGTSARGTISTMILDASTLGDAP